MGSTMAPTSTMANTTDAPGSNTTGAPTTGVTTITGSLGFDLADAAQCALLQTPNGTAAMQQVISDASGWTNLADISVTVTCGTRRRLSDGRRLTGPKATAAYTITIPAGSAATAATNAKNALTAYTATQFTNAIVAQMLAKGHVVVVSAMVPVAPTSTTTSNVSFAASMFSVGAAGIFAWLILALR